MKFNDRELCDLSKSPADLEGRLSFRKTTTTISTSTKGKPGFKDRWFKLKNNLLFYFKTDERGQVVASQPDGVFVLENVLIHQEAYAVVPFAFSIIFKDDMDKKYVMSTRSEKDVFMWMSALKKVSYEYLRFQLVILQEKIKTITGRDPLLLVPRNKPILYSSSHLREDSSSFRSYNVDLSVTYSVSQKTAKSQVTQNNPTTVTQTSSVSQSSHTTSHRSHTTSEFFSSAELFPPSPVPVANLIDL